MAFMKCLFVLGSLRGSLTLGTPLQLCLQWRGAEGTQLQERPGQRWLSMLSGCEQGLWSKTAPCHAW